MPSGQSSRRRILLASASSADRKTCFNVSNSLQQQNLAMVIAKIEKPEAVELLEQVVAAADGIMVRAVTWAWKWKLCMPVIQKQIIDTCQRLKKPVIVATQMLDSMQRATRPTRAEVTDVANAILDGTDGWTLSGETAVGSYPVESVEMMNRIMLFTEQSVECSPRRRDFVSTSIDLVHPVTSAVVNLRWYRITTSNT